MSGFAVVDASVAVKWLVEEPDSDKAVALVATLAANQLQPVAPYLLPIEVANVLHRHVVRRRLAVVDAEDLVEALLASGVNLREPPGLHARALRIANQLNQNAVYDAHYLALAEILDCELWTADSRFQRAAGRSGRVRLLGA